MIKQDSIQKVIETARIEEVVEEFVHLKRAGVNMKGNCPFHNEKTPSFVVSPAKGIYKCFGCGRAGNSVQFLIEHEKLNFIEAIQWLASKYNIELEETERTAEEIARKDIKDSLFILNEFAKKTFQNNLFSVEEGRNIGLAYFKERGFNESTIKKFDLGYALANRTDLYDQLKTGQYNLEIAEQLGLIKEGRDFFNDRVMFTIHNLSGKVVGFGGRTLSKEKKIPKYINSPESEIYNKRKTLYGLYHAKTAIRKADECIIVEGYTDVITLHQAGIENVVAASGTSLTEEQVSLIKRYSTNVKVLFDGDNAGVKAALRGMDMILAQDMNVKLVLLPEGEDPDSFLKKSGADSFSNFIAEKGQDFIKFKTDLLISETKNDPINKSIAIKSIIESISKIPDTLKRSLYIKEYSAILEIDESVLHSETNHFIKSDLKKNRFKDHHIDRSDEVQYTKPSLITSQQENKSPTYDSDEHQERYLLKILVNFSEELIDEDEGYKVKDYIFDNIDDILEKIENDFYRRVLYSLIADSDEGKVLDNNYFFNHADAEIQKLAIDLISSPFVYANWSGKGLELQTQKAPEENFKEDARQAVLRLKARKVKKVLEETKNFIEKMDSADDEQKILYIKTFQKLKSDLSDIHKLLGTVVFHK